MRFRALASRAPVIFTLYMSSDSVLLIAAIFGIPALFGFVVRRSFPRFALGAFGLAMCAGALWLIVSTLELSKTGLTHTLSRAPGTISAVTAPEAYAWSYWIHLGLGSFVFLFGAAMVCLPFTARGRRIKFPSKTEPSWSFGGVSRLFGLALVVFILIGVWRSFRG